MIIKNPKFEISAVSSNQYPKGNLSELVLVGKSNVGKSSFINTMVNRKNLARTSTTPGKTRQINFYNIDNSFYFVDLPGYGYSKMPKSEQLKCGKFIEEYLLKRKNISTILFLLDIRHKPTQDDILMYNFLIQNELYFIIIVNKADKIAKTKINNYILNIKKELDAPDNLVFLPFSSENKVYSDIVWNELIRN